MDSFASGQMKSKIWLVENLEKVLTNHPQQGYRIWLLAGWYGVTNTILRIRNNLPIQHVRSFDIDPIVQPVADNVNSLWVWQEWQFKAFTQDINTLEYDVHDPNAPHIIINTSVEHLESKEWFDKIPPNTLVVLQSNNMPHDDHCKEYNHYSDLLNEFPLTSVLYQDSIHFDYVTWSFDRHMVIGYK